MVASLLSGTVNTNSLSSISVCLVVVFYQSNSRITNTRLLFILFVLRQASLEHVLIINPFAIVSECLQLFPFPTTLRLQVKAAAQQALTQLSHLLVFSFL